VVLTISVSSGRPLEKLPMPPLRIDAALNRLLKDADSLPPAVTVWFFVIENFESNPVFVIVFIMLSFKSRVWLSQSKKDAKIFGWKFTMIFDTILCKFLVWYQ
jgi:hypothetical protein